MNLNVKTPTDQKKANQNTVTTSQPSVQHSNVPRLSTASGSPTRSPNSVTSIAGSGIAISSAELRTSSSALGLARLTSETETQPSSSGIAIPTQITSELSSSITQDIFGNPSVAATTMSASNGPVTYSKQIYSDLGSLTGTTVITTSAEVSNSAGIIVPTSFPVIVGPGGVHWTPLCGGLPCPGGGPKVPPCLGILCPPNSGGSSGSSGGKDPSDPDDPDDPESDDGDDDDGGDDTSATQSDAKTSQPQTSDTPSSTSMMNTTRVLSTLATSTSARACAQLELPPEEDSDDGWPIYANTTAIQATGTVTTSMATQEGSESSSQDALPSLTSIPNTSSTPITSEPSVVPTTTSVPPVVSTTSSIPPLVTTSASLVAITSIPPIVTTSIPPEVTTSVAPVGTTSILSVVTTSVAPAYATGQCNVHVWQGLGQELGDPDVHLDVTITDANGAQIGANHDSVDWGSPLVLGSLLPNPLEVTPVEDKPGKLAKRVGGAIPAARPLHEDGPVSFGYADQAWDTTSGQCSVGGWDNGNAGDFFASFFTGDTTIPVRSEIPHY
ncbi:MAG: hypothetical protein Q9195_007972 [Heterodermia aff. obscurata]